MGLCRFLLEKAIVRNRNIHVDPSKKHQGNDEDQNMRVNQRLESIWVVDNATHGSEVNLTFTSKSYVLVMSFECRV